MFVASSPAGKLKLPEHGQQGKLLALEASEGIIGMIFNDVTQLWRARVKISLISVLSVTAAVVSLLIPTVALAQSAPEGWTAPRTADGRPDLGGVWANNNATPIERPEAWEGKDVLGDEELAAVMAAAVEAGDPGQDALFGDQLILAAIEKTKATSYDPTTGNYNQFWIADRVFNTNRTSLVVNPSNGRIPSTTASADAAIERATQRLVDHPADWTTDRPLSERCITYGAPNIFAGYNSYFQLIQGADYVSIVQEMIHDARIIPIDGPPHLDKKIEQLHGDPRGHWDGDTLVIETTNYNGQNVVLAGLSFTTASTDLTVTERITRVSPEILNYEVTFDDPAVWEAPWTVLIPLRYSPEPIFEYACHEGNIGMDGILAGHRALEREAAMTEAGSR